METILIVLSAIAAIGVIIFLISGSDSFDSHTQVDLAEFKSLERSYSNETEFVEACDLLEKRFRKENRKLGYFRKLEWFKDQMRLKVLVKEHYEPLKRNLDKSLIVNDYGAIVQDNRQYAIEEFMSSVGFRPREMQQLEAYNMVVSTIDDYTEQRKSFGFDPSNLPSDGFEFEHWVAENLTKFGWSAKATQGSGDQGLDVIAEKNGVTVGIQCKLYSGNVGNKAVQEIISAKSFFDLDKAAVLTNAGYTKSARELALKADIELLHPEDISRFDSIFL